MTDIYETHFGVIDSEYKPEVPYFLSIEEIQSGGWILIVFLLAYLWYGMVLVKLKYLNPVLEDICEILDEKKSYITKSFFYMLYQNMDIVAILFYGKFLKFSSNQDPQLIQSTRQFTPYLVQNFQTTS